MGHGMGNDPAHVVLATGAVDPPVERAFGEIGERLYEAWAQG
jgi:hypothetical protein